MQGPKQIKVGFRVGLNEGVIVTRENLASNDAVLYTDGLSGCAALAVINDKYAFLVHVFSGSEENTIDKRAIEYVEKIIDWFNKHGGATEIEIVTDREGDCTAQAFVKALDSLTIRNKLEEDAEWVLVKERQGCCIKAAGSGFSITALGYGSINPHLIVGTVRRNDLIEDRIDASNYGFGASNPGDCPELHALIKIGWKSPALIRHVEDVVKLFSAKRGTGYLEYQFVLDFLKIANNQISYRNKTATEKDYITICLELKDLIEHSAITKGADDYVTAILDKLYVQQSPQQQQAPQPIPEVNLSMSEAIKEMGINQYGSFLGPEGTTLLSSITGTSISSKGGLSPADIQYNLDKADEKIDFINLTEDPPS
jgi:hypothetical protein